MRKALVPGAALLATMAGISTASAGPCLTLATADDRAQTCSIADTAPYVGGGVTDLPANIVANVVLEMGATQLAAGPSGGGIVNSPAIGFEPIAPLLAVGGEYRGSTGGSGKAGGNGKGSGATPGTGSSNPGTDPIQLVGFGPNAGNGGGAPPSDPPPSPVGAVPEPGALALLAAGLTGLAGFMALWHRL